MFRNRRAKARKRNSIALSPARRMSGGIPADVQELVRRAENPEYQRFPCFDLAWARMRDVLAGRCCRLGLFGACGAGKTAAARRGSWGN